jgi:hypothetical protein
MPAGNARKAGRKRPTPNVQHPTSNAEGTIGLALKNENILDVIVVTTRQAQRRKELLYGKRTEVGKIGAGTAGW